MTVPAMVREGRGRYRIGDFAIQREAPRLWRTWWIPEADERRVRAGLKGEGFPTLREARAHVEAETAFAAEAAPAEGASDPAPAGTAP